MSTTVQHGIVWWLFVGLIAGWLTGKIMAGRGYGIVMDIVLGLLGAVLGGVIARALNIGGGLVSSILIATVGAILIVIASRLIRGER